MGVALFMACGGVSDLSAKSKPLVDISHQTDEEMTSMLRASGGVLTPELKDAFLKRQKAAVLQALKTDGKNVDPAMLKWVDADEDARMAVYGTVCPADPNILLNLDQLWKDQGPQFTQKYKQLSLAAAVARRGFGVGPMANFGKWGGTYKSVREAVEAGKDPAEVLMQGKDKTSHILPKSDADQLAFKKVSDYLKSNKINNRQAVEDEEHRKKVAAMIKASGSSMQDIHVLRGLLITEGQRPKTRTQTPKVADYYQFLVKAVETPASEMSLEPGQRWPVFPTTTAPWPLLMPLAHGIPLDEAQFIVEKYQGKHGPKRLHNYGPYRKGAKAFHPKFEDRKWHWSSYPSTILEGGVCGTMSTISMQAYTALGKPILKAGQPKHSCLVGYNVSSDGLFVAGVGQSATAGPDGTGTSWLFQDGNSWKCYGGNTNAVHHYGLALSMNPGLVSYMDTRIGLHLYRHLSKAERKTIGHRLLMSLLEKNPFNTELWYTLAKDAKDMKTLLTVLSQVDAQITSQAKAGKIETRDASAAIEGAEQELKKKKKSDGVVASYKRYVKEAIVLYALADPAQFSPEDQKKALAFLAEKKAGGNKESVLAYERFYAAVHGPAVLKGEIEKDLTRVLSDKKKGKKKLAGDLRKSMMQIDLIVLERAEREIWLKGLLAQFPAEKAASKNKKGKIKIDPVYLAISDALRRSYSLEPRNKAGLKELHTQKKKLQRS